MSTTLVPIEPHIICGSPEEREARGQRLATLFIGEMIPLLVQVRQDFFEKEPAETICGVTTFTEYCTAVLRYSAGHIRHLIEGKNPATAKHDGSANRKPKPSEITDKQLEDYEYANRIEVRKLAKNFLDSGMSSEDAIGALVGLEVPEPYAKAAVRIVSGSAVITVQEPEAETQPPDAAEPVPTSPDDLVALFLNPNIVSVKKRKGLSGYDLIFHNISGEQIAVLARFVNKMPAAFPLTTCDNTPSAPEHLLDVRDLDAYVDAQKAAS